jgi:class 3 adenylate cyclase
MLSLQIQRQLVQRYGGAGLVKEAFDQEIAKGFATDFEEERREYAVVMMVDVTNFSTYVSKWPAAEIRDYLDAYYAKAMPIIFGNRGMIDRIAGDGILAVFSPFFTGRTNEETDRDGLRTAEALIAKLSETNYSSKAVLACGPLVFCKTGIAGIYEESTVIGKAITRAYRMEEIAEEDQVVIQASARFAKIIDEQIEASAVPRLFAPRRTFRVNQRTIELRGLGPTKVYVKQLKPQR